MRTICATSRSPTPPEEAAALVRDVGLRRFGLSYPPRARRILGERGLAPEP